MKIKKLLIMFFLAIIIIFAITVTACDKNKNDSSFEFSISTDNKSYKLSSYNGNEAEVTIPSEYNSLPVTEIGWNAFNHLISLKSVTIPPSIVYIYPDAFNGCFSLTSVHLSDINAWCNINFFNESSNPLKYAKNLYLNGELVTDLIIPEEVTTINSFAFYNCNSLTSVSISNSVTNIGYSAFKYCNNLEVMTIPFVGNSEDSRNARFGDIFGAKNNENIPPSLKKVIISEGAKIIDDYAFYQCANIESVSIPSGISYFGINAFINCDNLNRIDISDLSAWCEIDFINYDSNPLYYAKNLYLNGELVTELTIPKDVKRIGKYSFFNDKNLTKIKFEEESQLKSIGENAFAACGSLTSVILPNGITDIANNAFEMCGNLTSIIIPNTLTNIGDLAFSDCASLLSISLPQSVTVIGKSAFRYCNSLIILAEAESCPSGWKEDWNGYRFRPIIWNSSVNDKDKDGYSYLIEESITYRVKDGLATLYAAPANLKSVNIKTAVTYKGITYNVTSIGDGAFNDCRSLESIIIPDSVTSIGKWAFNGTGIWNNAENNGVVYADKWAVGYKGTITTPTLRSDTVGIGSFAFIGCGSLVSITIPNGILIIDDSALTECYSLIIYAEAESVPSGWNDSWNSSYRPIIWNCNTNDKDKDGYSYIIEENITYRLKDGIATVYAASNIILKANIKTTVTYKGTTYAVTSLGYRAFYRCSSLESITIPNSVTSIDSYALFDCSSLKSIAIPNSITSIGSNAFYYCSSLISITIPNSVTSIDSWAFFYCDSLTSITIPNSITNIDYSTFAYCGSLTNITIPESVTSIGFRAFYECSSLSIYAEVESKPSGWDSDWNPNNRPVIWNCNANDEDKDGYMYSIEEGITYRMKDGLATLYAAPTNLKTANIKSTVTYKGGTYAVTSIGAYAFNKCNSIESIIIPESITNIDSYAFRNCYRLSSVTIPDSVTSIGESAFSLCNYLTIYAQAKRKPSGWNKNWNPDNRPVEWNYKKK